MVKIADINFHGKQNTYSFEVHPANTVFTEAVGAVYIFTKRELNPNGTGSHTCLYIGQTNSLKDRIPNHEKLDCVNTHGGNCICIHYDGNSKSRLDKETDLRANYKTACNEQ